MTLFVISRRTISRHWVGYFHARKTESKRRLSRANRCFIVPATGPKAACRSSSRRRDDRPHAVGPDGTRSDAGPPPGITERIMWLTGRAHPRAIDGRQR